MSSHRACVKITRPAGGEQTFNIFGGWATEESKAENAALYCTEGGQVRTMRCKRVVNPPGGKSSIPGLSEPMEPTAAPLRPTNVAVEAAPVVAAKPMAAAKPTATEAEPSLFCSEGSQLRHCACRRIVAPPGGKSSFTFGQ